MRFDKILMNPPYDGGLHLRILKECTNFSDNIINLSPVRWLQDPLLKYKKSAGDGSLKNGEVIKKYVKSIEIISCEKASEFFGTRQEADLGIYELTKEGGFDFSIFENPIIDKIMQKTSDTILSHLESKPSQYNVKIPHVYGNLSFFISPNKDISLNSPNSDFGNRTKWLNFQTKEEAENCFNVFFTDFWIWLNNKTKLTRDVNKCLPYLDYSHKWTNEDLYSFFGITDQEKRKIENEVRQSNNESTL